MHDCWLFISLSKCHAVSIQRWNALSFYCTSSSLAFTTTIRGNYYGHCVAETIIRQLRPSSRKASRTSATASTRMTRSLRNGCPSVKRWRLRTRRMKTSPAARTRRYPKARSRSGSRQPVAHFPSVIWSVRLLPGLRSRQTTRLLTKLMPKVTRRCDTGNGNHERDNLEMCSSVICGRFKMADWRSGYLNYDYGLYIYI